MQNFTPLQFLPSVESKKSASFNIIPLFSRTLKRYRTHFVKYFLTNLIGLGIIAATIVISIFGFLLLNFIISLVKLKMLLILFIPLVVVSFFACLYAVFWSGLALVLMMKRADSTISVSQNFKEARKLVLPFLLFFLFLAVGLIVSVLLFIKLNIVLAVIVFYSLFLLIFVPWFIAFLFEM